MRLDLLKEALEDPRAGLFFLAGLNDGPDGTPQVVTVHAASGMLSQEERAFINDSIAWYAPRLGLEVREHDANTLHEARSLACLARRFAHGTVLADPTRSFARLTALLDVVKALRAAYGAALGPILWEPRAARLLVVPGEVHEENREALKAEIDALVAKQGGDILDRVIASVELGQPHPARRYTPVDAKAPERPRSEEKPRRNVTLRVKLATIAAMVGFGSMAAAGAPPKSTVLDRDDHLPGIAAFVDLTALGESAFGTRNPFKAAGGLRLYFGDTDALTRASFEPAGSGFIVDTPQPNHSGEDATPDEDPIHLAYGA